MELRHLKHFVTIAKLKHFNRAAGELNLAQSSLSRSIQKLESLLGVKLLDRNAKNVQLTVHGELVLQHSKEILKKVDTLKCELQGVQTTHCSKRLVVGASSSLAAGLLGSAVGEFVRRYPSVEIDLRFGSRKELCNALLQRDISCYITEDKGKRKGVKAEYAEKLIYTKLPDYRAVFCCRPNHPVLGSPGRVTKDKLKFYPLAFPSNIHVSLVEKFGDLFKRTSKNFGALVRFDQFHPIKMSIQSCDMLAVTLEVAIRQELSDGGLTCLFPEDMSEVGVGFCVVTLKEKTHDLSVMKFMTCLIPQNITNTMVPITK